MKIGDLVRCNYQPKSSGYNTKTGCMKPMLHHIKGELGIIIRYKDELSAVVYFPQFEYEHPLSRRALESVNESR
jgi:hypothetical protein|tara:strand:+ start:86 stop:307 length:222 start_codon:yes stop_codon:yes gene_type:complete